MSIVRSIIAALLALTLAVTPAVARAAFAVVDAPAATSSHSSHAKMSAMPDCHRAMQHDVQQPAKDTHHKTCPDCDKRGACNADGCQLKCFKVLGAVSESRKPLAFISARLRASEAAIIKPVSFKPQPPPPRI